MPVVITNGLDNVGATVGRVIEPYLVDVAFSQNAAFSILYAKGRIMEHDPGFDITWSVMTDKLNSGTYKGIFKFPGQEKNIFRPATVEFKQAYADAVISGRQALLARGPYAAWKLADGIKQAAKMSVMDEMGKQFYADGYGNGSADFDGTSVAIDDGSLYSTYATIPRASVPGWNSPTDSTGGPFTFPAMTHMQTRATVGADSPDLAITDPTTWEEAANRISSQQIFDKNSGDNEVANLGFRVISNLGCNLVYDAASPAGELRGYNTEYMQFSILKDRVWSWTGWEKIPGTDGYQGQFLLMGNFQFKAPRMFFAMYNLT